VRKRDLRILDEIIRVRGSFGHRQHLELAWSYLGVYSIDEAAEVMTAAIRHVARSHGAADKYHETITRSWLHFVAVHRQRWGAEGFDPFLDRNPDLLNRNLVEHFYSRELIFSDSARAGWVDPDLRQLPALV
jgi:hypothetical protein